MFGYVGFAIFTLLGVTGIVIAYCLGLHTPAPYQSGVSVDFSLRLAEETKALAESRNEQETSNA